MIGAKMIMAGAMLSVAMSGVAFWRGHVSGKATCKAANAADLRQTQSDLFDVADQLSVTNARLVAQEAAQKALSEGIEDEARKDTDPCRVPSDASLQRLKRRWGAAP